MGVQHLGAGLAQELADLRSKKKKKDALEGAGRMSHDLQHVCGGFTLRSMSMRMCGAWTCSMLVGCAA